jgi:hypothetical protein
MQAVVVARFLRTPNLILQNQQDFLGGPQSLSHACLKLTITSIHAQLLMTLRIDTKIVRPAQDRFVTLLARKAEELRVENI